jgi:hypothetical protein
MPEDDGTPIERATGLGDDPTQSAMAWRRYLSWPLLITLAWVVYELTAQPTVAVVVGCAKFGWDDMQTAAWLRRTDPLRARAWACFWFHLACALWKVAGIAAGVMLLIIILMPILQQPQKLVLILGPAALEMLCGFLLASLLSWSAACFAWRKRVRIWLDSKLHYARNRRSWPPNATGRNNAGPILAGSLQLALATITASVCLLAVWAQLSIKPLLGLLAIAVLTACVLARRIARNVVAVAPHECWPELAFPRVIWPTRGGVDPRSMVLQDEAGCLKI